MCAREDDLPAPQGGVAQLGVGVIAARGGRLLAKVDARDHGNLQGAAHCRAHDLRYIQAGCNEGIRHCTSLVTQCCCARLRADLGDDVQQSRDPVEVAGEGCGQRDGRVEMTS